MALSVVAERCPPMMTTLLVPPLWVPWRASGPSRTAGNLPKTGKRETLPNGCQYSFETWKTDACALLCTMCDFTMPAQAQRISCLRSQEHAYTSHAVFVHTAVLTEVHIVHSLSSPHRAKDPWIDLRIFLQSDSVSQFCHHCTNYTKTYFESQHHDYRSYHVQPNGGYKRIDSSFDSIYFLADLIPWQHL